MYYNNENLRVKSDENVNPINVNGPKNRFNFLYTKYNSLFILLNKW